MQQLIEDLQDIRDFQDILDSENRGLFVEQRLNNVEQRLNDIAVFISNVDWLKDNKQRLNEADEKKRLNAVLVTEEDFLRFLKYLIEDMGMSKKNITQNLGINRVTINKILNGKHYVTKRSMRKANDYLTNLNNQFFY